MLTTEEREERRVHFINRFRERSFSESLEREFTDTKEAVRMSSKIKSLENELSDIKRELYIARNAHSAIINEQRVRIDKKSLGIRDDVDALLVEVYERAQQVKKLRGENLSWRSRRGGSYPAIRHYVKAGKFGNGYDNCRDFHPMFVEQSLLGDALGVLAEDSAKKGQELYQRVHDRYMKVRKEWTAIDQPVDRKEAE